MMEPVRVCMRLNCDFLLADIAAGRLAMMMSPQDGKEEKEKIAGVEDERIADNGTAAAATACVKEKEKDRLERDGPAEEEDDDSADVEMEEKEEVKPPVHTPPAITASNVAADTPPPPVVVESANFIPYPKPLAKYEDVVADQKLFIAALEKLHALMATKFMVPVIGGKELDLHRLFKEVTSRGGIEKVKADGRWREVTASFNFPSTATNASFILKKYYMSLLHHFEQIYYFGSKGWLATATDPSTLASSIGRTHEAGGLSSDVHAPIRKRCRKDDAFSPASQPSLSGVIDGKFEYGYLITAMVGTQKMRGVLYPCPDQPPPNPNPAVPYAVADAYGNVKRRRRRRKKLSKRDPTHPKPNRSGYNFFFAEQHARLKPLHPGKDREISKMIGELWNKLTESDKAVYQERGVKDKERYKSEMAVYREKLKTTGYVISDAVPIQQRVAEPTMVLLDGGGINAGTKLGMSSMYDRNDDDRSSDESDDMAGKSSDEDSDTDSSPGASQTAAADDQAGNSDAFELRRRESAPPEHAAASKTDNS